MRNPSVCACNLFSCPSLPFCRESTVSIALSMPDSNVNLDAKSLINQWGSRLRISGRAGMTKSVTQEQQLTSKTGTHEKAQRNEVAKNKKEHGTVRFHAPRLVPSPRYFAKLTVSC